VLSLDRCVLHANVAGGILQTLTESGHNQRLFHRGIIKPGEHLLSVTGSGNISGHAIGSRQTLERERVVPVLFQVRNGQFVFLLMRQVRAHRTVKGRVNNFVVRVQRQLREFCHPRICG